MKRTFTIALALMMLLPAAALAGDDHGHEHDEAMKHEKMQTSWATNEEGVVLNGYDPVSYFQNEKPKMGAAEYSTEYEGATFWFASQDNMNTFMEKPEKYVPRFGGHCAFAVAAKGKKVAGDPTSYEIRDGQLLVFYHGEMDGEKVDAKKLWNEKGAEQMHMKAQKTWKQMHGHHEKTKKKETTSR